MGDAGGNGCSAGYGKGYDYVLNGRDGNGSGLQPERGEGESFNYRFLVWIEEDDTFRRWVYLGCGSFH